jgi:hypothetical protein
MLSDMDQWYINQLEPNKSCFLALRELILSLNDDITLEWKYKLPFFYLRGKMFCYLWQDKKTKEPYIGVADGYKLEHPILIKGDRKRIKIIHVDAIQDIDVIGIKEALEQVIKLSR